MSQQRSDSNTKPGQSPPTPSGDVSTESAPVKPSQSRTRYHDRPTDDGLPGGASSPEQADKQ